MNTLYISTFEEVHHVCLMYSLKKTYQRYPFLMNNIMATPPPFRRNPKSTLLFLGSKLNPICVQYFKQDIRLLYDENRVSESEITAFAKSLIDDYLAMRHPYMQCQWKEQMLTESRMDHLIAKITL